MSEKLIWILGIKAPATSGTHEPVAVTDDEVVAMEWVDRMIDQGNDAKSWTFHLNEVP